MTKAEIKNLIAENEELKQDKKICTEMFAKIRSMGFPTFDSVEKYSARLQSAEKKSDKGKYFIEKLIELVEAEDCDFSILKQAKEFLQEA